MKLSSVLNVMDLSDEVVIFDDDPDLPLDQALLFSGTGWKAKTISKYRNAVVKLLLPSEFKMTIFVDISYQKKHHKDGDGK